jgi:hypothetical protein
MKNYTGVSLEGISAKEKHVRISGVRIRTSDFQGECEHGPSGSEAA